MKKISIKPKTIIALIIIVLVVGALFITYPSKDKLLKSAVELDLQAYEYMQNENMAKTVSDYEGKSVILNGVIKDIQSDCIIIRQGDFSIAVYPWNREEIETLSKNDNIKIVGELDSVKFGGGDIRKAFIID